MDKEPITFRLPEKTHIGQIWLQTTKLERALGFYQNALDFKIIESCGRHAALSTTGDRQAQIILTEKSCETLTYRPTVRPHLFAVRLPTIKSLSEAYLRLKRMNIPIHGFVQQKVCISIFLAAPDDYVVELYADLPRSAWRWYNGKLLRSSTPLDDFDSLTAMDQHYNDSGMPSEAGIGHLDLYVQDIEAAKRFFCDVLGMTVTGGDYANLVLAAGIYHQHLTLRKCTCAMGNIASHGVLVGYRLAVPDMQIINDLQKRLQRFGHERRMVSFRPGLLRLTDPCGCALEIQSADYGELAHEEALNV